MKRISMKRSTRLVKAFALVMLTLLLFSTLSLGIGASDNAAGVQWTMLDEEHQRLSGDGVIYHRVELPEGYREFSFSTSYRYANRVEGYGTSAWVYSFEKDGYLVAISSGETTTTFYCREDMLDALQAYLNGESGNYLLRSPAEDTREWSSSDVYYDPSADLVEALLSEENAQTVECDVTQLKDLSKLELRRRDKSGMLDTHLGTLYIFPDGGVGFVNYQKLDNTHFDADGYFSYRSGIVRLTVPDAETVKEITACTQEGYHLRGSYDYEATYEDDYYENVEDSFWSLIVFAGYLLPVAPLVIGLVFANSPKMGRSKRWYVVAGLAAAWLLMAVVLTVIVLI